MKAAIGSFEIEEVPKEEQHPDWICNKVVLLRMRLREKLPEGGLAAFESRHRVNQSTGLIVTHLGGGGDPVCKPVPIRQLYENS